MYRILMIGPSLEVRGGVSKVEQLIIQGLSGENEVKHLSSMNDRSVIGRFFPFLLLILRLPFSILFFRPDFVHLHMSADLSWFRKIVIFTISKLLGQRVFLHPHSGHLPRFIEMSPFPINRVIRWQFRASEGVLTLGNKWKKYYEKRFGLDSRRVHILYNPVERPELGAEIKRDTHTFLFVGKLGENKGSRRILEAYQKIAISDELPDSRLILCGNGAVKQTKSIIESLNLSNFVEIKGWLDNEDLRGVYCEASVLLLPSKAEGLPMALLEAMSYGVVPITTKVGAIPEIVDRNSGWLVENSEDSLHDAMVESFNGEMLSLKRENLEGSLAMLYIENYCRKLTRAYATIDG